MADKPRRRPRKRVVLDDAGRSPLSPPEPASGDGATLGEPTWITVGLSLDDRATADGAGEGSLPTPGPGTAVDCTTPSDSQEGGGHAARRGVRRRGRLLVVAAVVAVLAATTTTWQAARRQPVASTSSGFAGLRRPVCPSLPRQPAAPRWTFSAESGFIQQVVQDGDVVMFTEGGGRSTRATTVVGVDARTGRQRWAFDRAGGISRVVAAGGGILVVVGAESPGVIEGWSTTKGELRWQAAAGANQDWFPAVLDATGGTIITSDETATIVAVDRASGAIRWRAPADGFALLNGLVIVAVDGQVRGLDPSSGQARWETTLELGNVRLSGAGDLVVAAGDSQVAALDTSGRLLWLRALSVTGLYSVHRVGPSVVVAANSTLTALDAASGAERWTRSSVTGVADISESSDGQPSTRLVAVDGGGVRVLAAADGAEVASSSPAPRAVGLAADLAYTVEGSELVARSLDDLLARWSVPVPSANAGSSGSSSVGGGPGGGFRRVTVSCGGLVVAASGLNAAAYGPS